MHYAERIIAGAIAIALVGSCTTTRKRVEPAVAQVLFVCEHGNVKSLMAASYFNQLAQERGLSFRGVSRGSAPDSTTVPATIVAGLSADGIDVSEFHPEAVSAADTSTSLRVVTIGTTLPASAIAPGTAIEQWNDVPPASVHYGTARDSLKAHIDTLVGDLESVSEK
jgi:arsenate reductase (thioredoxin)